MNIGTIVTFYSYKGGVGRTLALANIGALLCKWGYKVLCIDWDLEAPGLHLYFNKWIDRQEHEGVTDLILAFVDGANPKWEDYITEVRFPDVRKPLHLMNAGKQDDLYVSRMQALEWKKLYEDFSFGNYLEELRDKWKESYDFILVDSRTGITDIGGICTVQLPDFLALMFTANDQSLNGSVDVVKRAKHARNALPFDRAQLLVLPIITRFEIRIEYLLAQEWLDKFAIALAPLYSEWADKDITASELLNFTRIPYIPYWSFGEKVPVIEKGVEDPEDIGFSLETLAALIAQKLSYSDSLIRNRDSFVAAARRGPSNAEIDGQDDSSVTHGLAAKLFVSYSNRDARIFEALSKHLAALQQQNIIEAWHDRRLSPGADSKTDIDPYLEEADVILLLISADYLASDYIYGTEMLRAIERHEQDEACVIPIILRPCDWQGTPFAKLQALPMGGVPVTQWQDPDEAFLNIVEGIKTAVRLIKANPQ